MAPKIEQDEKTTLLQKFKDWHKSADDHQREWREEAETCYDFVAGRQWTQEDLDKLEDEDRPDVTFNRIAPVLDSVAGTEVNNRQEVRYIARKEGTVQANEILGGAAKWVRDECDAEDEESHAFQDACICGLGATETRLETDEDPEGEILIIRTDPLEFMWDPRANKKNLVNAQWVMRFKDVQRQDAETMFPDADSGDLHAAWAMEPIGDQPEDTTSSPFYEDGQSSSHVDLKNKVRLVEVQWWEHEVYHFVMDPFTGQKLSLDDKQLKELNKKVKLINKGLQQQTADAALPSPPELLKVDSVKMRRKKYRRAFVGAEVLQVDDNPCPYSFTYKFVTGKLDRNKNLWYGIVKAMLDPQRWANKWLSQTMYIMNSNAKGGLLAETDAFANPKKAEEEWTNPDAITWMNPGGLNKIKEKALFQFPQGFFQLMQFAISSIPDTTGINLNFVALAKGDEAAILDRQRKQTALTILSTMFDNLRRYRKEQGRLLEYYITHFISDGRLIRVTADELEQYIPLMRQPGIEKHDIIVDDNPTSPSQKDKTWSILLQLMPFLQNLPLPPEAWLEVVKQSPLPNSFVQTIKKATETPPPPHKPSPLEEAEVAKLMSEAKKNTAVAEKESRATEWQETVNITQLFPLLSQAEQAQVLRTLGITPTPLAQMTPLEEPQVQQQFPPGMVPIEGRQYGGPVDAGQPYLVGEQGPEVVVPQQQAMVIPNPDVQKITEILQNNAGLNFVQRLMKPDINPLLYMPEGPGDHGTHLMSSAEVNGKNIVYPEIVQGPDGNLKRLSREEAWKHAIDTGEHITFDTPEEAKWFGENYKKVWGRF